MPFRYSVSLNRDAEKQLKKLAKAQPSAFQRVTNAIKDLAYNPRPDGVKKLKGTGNGYRVRVGEYRVLYTIEDREVTVWVYRVASRQGAY